MNAKYLILFLLLGFGYGLIGQINPEQNEVRALKMLARTNGKEIKLRWAPTSPETWFDCNKVGYVLVRHTYKRNGQLLGWEERSVAVPMTENPIFPLQTEEEWQPLMQRNEYAAIGAQAIFGDSFGVETGTEGFEASLTNKAADDLNRYGFGLFAADHSFEAAEAMGLAYVDKTAKPGESYVYRIYPAIQPSFPIGEIAVGEEESIPIGEISRVDTGSVAVGTNDVYTLPKILEVTANFDNRSVLISWNKELFKLFYVSYIIEKSEDGLNWSSIRSKPFITVGKEKDGSDLAFIPDSLTQNNTPYFYRVKGVTPFDEVGPPSDPVQGMGIDPKPSYYPNITSISMNNEGGFNLGWEFNEGDNDKISGFEILRSSNDQGPFEKISPEELLPANARAFIDPNPLPTNYYLVVAKDQYAREMSSFAALGQIDDITPPAVPTNLRGTILKNGAMVVTWDKNNEPDFLGYRVYVSNHPVAEFTQVTNKPTPNNFFIDTLSLNTLTEELFVKVFSVDYRQNGSEFSEVTTLTRPDTIPPTSPVFRDIQSSTEGVTLAWANSSSKDVITHELKRSPLGEDKWQTIYATDLTNTGTYGNFVDSTAEVGKRFQYKIVATDNADLSSSSKIAQAQIIDNFIRKPVQKLNASADRKTKTITLEWEYPESDKVQTFIIFRANGERRMVSYAGTTPEESLTTQGRGRRKRSKFTFQDQSIKMNTDYQYSVKVLHKDGAQSPLAPAIQVNY